MYDYTVEMTNDEDFQLAFTATDEDDVPLDVSDWVIEFTIKDKYNCALLTFASDVDDEITLDLDDGLISILIDNSEFNAWDSGTYKMGCRYTNSEGRTKQLFTGALKIYEGEFD
jgi:hypothetical protein